MKTNRKFLFILLMFIASCAVGGFDIAQPFVTLKPEPVERVPEKIAWIDYEYETFEDSFDSSDKCAIVYIRQEVGCADCYAMDDVLNDELIVRLINKHFRPYLVSDDMKNWEKALSVFDVEHTPGFFIMAGPKLVQYRRPPHPFIMPFIFKGYEGYLGVSDLTSILLEGIAFCDRSN